MLILLICAIFILVPALMTLLNPKFTWADVAWVNIPSFLLLLLLQWFYFFTAPKLDTEIRFKDTFDKNEYFLKLILKKLFIYDHTLIFEILALCILLVSLNYLAFRNKRLSILKFTICIGLIFLTLSIISLSYFVFDYYRANTNQ